MSVSVPTAEELAALDAKLQASYSALDVRIKKLETAAPPVIPPEPPTTLPSVPTGINDPRFAGVKTSGAVRGPGPYNLLKITSQGEPCITNGPYTITNSIFLGREGPRFDGRGCIVEDCYAEIAGSGTDHGDGFQAYAPGSGGSAILRRVRLLMKPGANNCGIFFADNFNGDLTLEDVITNGNDNCPNGIIWLPNRTGDTGVKSISYKNVDFADGVKNGYCGIDYQGGGVKPVIRVWENVRVKGVIVNRPY